MIKVYSVFDNVSHVYSQPIFCGSGKDSDDDVAKRLFLTQVLNDTSLLHIYPEDYDLYELGMYDEETGHFEQGDHIRYICNGKELFETFKASKESEVNDVQE